MPLNKIIETDCAVVGDGLGGSAAAIDLADAGVKVDQFTKGSLVEHSNSYLIAGGLAAVPLVQGAPLEGDSFISHLNNTLKAGSYLNDREVVRYCIEHFFSDVIQWLIGKGVNFDRATQGYPYDLHKEGEHDANRVFHQSDTTGMEIMNVLSGHVERHSNIELHRNHVAIDLITEDRVQGIRTNKDTCLGLYVYDMENDIVRTVKAKSVILATGGLGKVFTYTSNPDVATGDGFAMCYRAGLPLANMEFIQFHPTVFYDPNAKDSRERIFLFTEALRGAGAILKLSKDGPEDFVLKYDPEKGSNSSRDVVSRAEDIEMRENRLTNVWLDCTSIPPGKLTSEFTAAYEFCMSKGIDPTKEAIPVVYAVHYSNGGVLVDRNGATLAKDGSGIDNLYVVGETAYTGLHGATRLASNSGPEAVLYGRLAAGDFLRKHLNTQLTDVRLWNVGNATESRDKTLINYYWETIRNTMTQLCGISRTEERLEDAKVVLTALQNQIQRYYWDYLVEKDSLEVRNIFDVALAIIASAQMRKETRACHAMQRYPEPSSDYEGWTVVQKGREPYLLE